MKVAKASLCCALVAGLLFATADAQTAEGVPQLTFCCKADNDLYRVMTAGGKSHARVDSPKEAVGKAPSGSGRRIYT